MESVIGGRRNFLPYCVAYAPTCESALFGRAMGRPNGLTGTLQDISQADVMTVVYAAQASVISNGTGIPLYVLLKAGRMSPLEFFERFRQTCTTLSLQTSLLDLLKLLERRYVVTHLLFRKYEKLFEQVVETSELRANSNVSKSEAMKFGWLLFLVAKEKMLTDVLPDLVAALNVMICALSCTLSNWEVVPDPGLAAICRFCSCDVDTVVVLRQATFDPLIFSLYQNGILKTRMVPEEESRIRGLLRGENASANSDSLERLYFSSPGLCFDETLFLLSPSPPEGTPVNLVPLSPHATLLKGFDWLESLVRKVSVDEPSAKLLQFYQNCGENSFFKDAKNLLTQIRSKLNDVDGISEKFKYVQKTYFLLLETLLQSEEDKLQKSSNFSVLLNNESFHRSLIWCALEIVFYTFRLDKYFYPHNMSVTGVTTLDLIKIIESVLRSLPQLSSVMARRLSDIEEHLLEQWAWKRHESLWSYLQSPGVRAALSEWLLGGPPSGAGVSSPASVVSSPPPLGGFASPFRRGAPAGGAAVSLSFGAKLFFRKVAALSSRRVDALCGALGLPPVVAKHVLRTVLEVLVNTLLCFERHLDQVIMCAVYAVAKVYVKSVAHISGAQEIAFKEIVACYKTLSHYGRLTPLVFREVLMTSDKKASIIEFYNQMFVPEMDEFVLKLQSEYSSMAGDGNAILVTPRGIRVMESSALESSVVPSFKNVSVSPMKARPPMSPGAFRAHLGGGRSPARDLASISAAMKGRQTSKAQRKRLFNQPNEFDEDDDDDDDGDEFDDDDMDEFEGSNDESSKGLSQLLSVMEEASPKKPVSSPKRSKAKE